MGANLVCLLWGISDLGGKISNLGGGIPPQNTECSCRCEWRTLSQPV